MTRITATKQITFCAGHRLLDHEGDCAMLHGHNYQVDITMKNASVVDRIGRVIDFTHIKNRVKAWIDEKWDHGFILWDQDTEAIDIITQMPGQKLHTIPFNPTAENMARYLLAESNRLFDDFPGASVTKVIVWETPTSFAEATL